ncbi:MarR family EPS-associated transcriptional regulator [Methylotenera sp.]|uniref:MarR family EPS-associated transcriptional regulator n=1 Tax=Methylotenera sp. TaxID=2051956 RepID=UPI00248964A7|nr:MarR family EPS-associated transcriptional regulator [Methylotenera sp.]MDI1361595.1 MarR family EPS-associated transcriptional regulator [Methylotenera sp.]
MLTDEYRYKILKLVEAKPEISQRELARSLGISLGKANFCLKALIEKGFLKATNFRNSQNKLAYMYLLTPNGIEEKSSITLRFLKIKMQEYELLKAEISLLVQETKSVLTTDATSDLEKTAIQMKVINLEK